jgi:regulator of protease activity HflC (stomatin/prohibitin superfamily)
MAIPRKKQQSASDVLRQEMQQPLVIPERATAPTTEPAPTPTPTPTTDMTQANDDAAQKAAHAAKEQVEALTKKLKDAEEMILKLSAQGQASAKGKSTAITKTPAARGSGLTARPTQSSEETARRRANTDIGWLD